MKSDVLRNNRVVLSVALSAMFAMPYSYAELKALDDEVLSGVSGQSGITLDLAAKANVAEVAYFDDGLGLALQGVQLSAADSPADFANYRFEVDILSDGALAIEFSSDNVGRFEIADMRFVSNPGITPGGSDPSMGGLFLDFMLDGRTEIRGGGVGGPGTWGHTFDTEFLLSNGRLGYRTNGNEVFFDGMTLDVSALGTTLDVDPGGVLHLRMPNLQTELSVDAIRFSDNPANHGVTNDVVSGLPLPSYGSLWVNADTNLDLQIQAGGAQGLEGLTLNASNQINRLDLAWGDDTDWALGGYWIGALGASGQISVQNLTLDVLQDPDAGVEPLFDNGVGLAIGFDQLAFNLDVRDFVLGETKSNMDAYVLNGSTPVKSIGSLSANLLFADGVFDGAPRTNAVWLQAGGNSNAGYQGLRLDTQLSLVSPNNESNFVYIDDGNALMLSKLEGFADGDITLDVTRAGNVSGTDFYDGLRVGFEQFAFGYQYEGMRLAKDTGDNDDLKSRQLQAGRGIEGLNSLTLGFAGAPSIKGTLNGHVTLGPGGADGAEGITINSDLSLSNGTMATYREEDGRGLWLSGLNYDVHLRDMMLDVTEDGLQIYQGESWSLMDVTDIRIGDEVTGASFGRLVRETYEMGSTRTIMAGGAGAVCVGGSGADQSVCEGDGGRWEDRGSEGVTISGVRFLQAENELEGKRNRLTWETGRTGEGGPAPVNGSGMQLVFDNYTTNDGDGLSDTFGLRNEYQLDIAGVQVVKKADGPDSNGVVGDKGDIKVMNADGSYRYVNPAALTAQDIQDRPVGIAVRSRTQFQELDFDQVKLVHPTGGESTLLYGLKFQNFDITTDISTTALD